jgi:hypothetical protein
MPSRDFVVIAKAYIDKQVAKAFNLVNYAEDIFPQDERYPFLFDQLPFSLCIISKRNQQMYRCI